MKKSDIYVGSAVLVIFLLGSIYIFLNFKNIPEENLAVNSGSKSEREFTLSEVSTHNSTLSCYTVISGNVYDITPWINTHPGGNKAILSICGLDGTKAFQGQHGGDSKPNNQLESFIIGKLSK